MMEIRKSVISTILTFVHVLLLVGPLYPFVGEASGLDGMKLVKFSVMGFLMIIPIVLSYYMLRKINSLGVYIFIMLIVTAGIAVIGGIYDDFFPNGIFIMSELNAIICFVIFTIRAYSKVTHNRIKKEFLALHSGEPFLLQASEVDNFLSNPSPKHWIWFSIIYILAIGFKLHTEIYVVFFTVLADVFVCFINNYMDRFYNYLKMNHRVANMPVSSMKKIHKYILLAGIVLITLFVLPAVLYHNEPLEKIELPEYRTLSFEFQDLYLGEQEPPALLEEEAENTMSPLVNYILHGLLIAIIMAIIIMVAVQIIRKILNIAKDFQLEDEDEVINLDEIDIKPDNFWRRKGLKRYLSENDKIRRKFKKAIRKGTKGKPDKAGTPRELELNADFFSNPENEGLHEKYERARYYK